MAKKVKTKNLTKIQKLAMIVGGLLFAILVSEIILRLLPDKATGIDISLIGEERIFTRTRDMKFRPNLTRVWTGLGRPTIWHYNELGYRERAIQLDKPENIYRIVVVGDSIVMGFGVEEYETISRQLEDKLRPRELVDGMSHFEVLSLGIQGYATPHYYAVIKEDALRMDPDVVIVMFYTNDLLESVSFEANKKYITLKSIPDMLPYGLNQFLKSNSRLYLLILGRYYNFVETTSVNIGSDEALKEIGWKYVRRDLEKMKDITNENEIKFVLVGIPNPTREVKDKNVSQERLRELQSIVSDYNINYYDLYDDLAEYRDTSLLYLDDYDDHFSVEGNDYVSGLLLNYLRKSSIIPEK